MPQYDPLAVYSIMGNVNGNKYSCAIKRMIMLKILIFFCLPYIHISRFEEVYVYFYFVHKTALKTPSGAFIGYFKKTFSSSMIMFTPWI